ncbi:MAG TPA: copper chaperone [Rhodospirillales bacterium]|nr:copper chaperone [Rhodospirillales bacterium]
MAVTYNVSGVTCGGCASSVIKAIKALSSEADVSVDVEAKTFTVEGFDDVDAIGQAVKDAGFEFGGPAH